MFLPSQVLFFVFSPTCATTASPSELLSLDDAAASFLLSLHTSLLVHGSIHFTGAKDG